MYVSGIKYMMYIGGNLVLNISVARIISFVYYYGNESDEICLYWEVCWTNGVQYSKTCPERSCLVRLYLLVGHILQHN